MFTTDKHKTSCPLKQSFRKIKSCWLTFVIVKGVNLCRCFCKTIFEHVLCIMVVVLKRERELFWLKMVKVTWLTQNEGFRSSRRRVKCFDILKDLCFRSRYLQIPPATCRLVVEWWITRESSAWLCRSHYILKQKSRGSPELLDWSASNHVFKNHTSFFLYLFESGRSIRHYLSALVKPKRFRAIQEVKKLSFSYCFIKNISIHLLKRNTVCGQMDLNKDNGGPTLRCQAKTKSPQKNTRDSDVYADDSTKRGQREAPSLPESAISEKNVQEIYPWMKEFRSKGTKQFSKFLFFAHLSGKRILERLKRVGGKSNPFRLLNIFLYRYFL